MKAKNFKKDNNNFVYRNFKSGIKYILDSRSYILFSTCLFLLIIILGFAFPVFFTEEIFNYIQQFVRETENLGGFQMIAFIINNNVWSSFFGLFLGFFLGASCGASSIFGFTSSIAQ